MNLAMKQEKRILNISFIGSILFLLAEIVFALITKSSAVFMDCIYDIADLIMIGPFILLIPFLYKPIEEKHPYGYNQVESLFIMFKSGMLLSVTVILIVNSIKSIINGGNVVDASLIAIYELLMSLICVIIYLILSKLSKKKTTPSIEAELYIWKLDSYSTLGVGLAFILSIILEHTVLSSISPYIDSIIAIVLAVILLKEPLSLFLESVNNLVLFAPDNETNMEIRSICEKHLSKENFYINNLEIIKTGRKYWIELYFVKEDDLVSINKIEELTKEISNELKEKYTDIYIEIVPDIEKIKPEIKEKMKSNRRPDKIKILDKKAIKKENKLNKTRN